MMNTGRIIICMGLASLLLICLFGLSSAESNGDFGGNSPSEGAGLQNSMMPPQGAGFPMGDPSDGSLPIEGQKMDRPFGMMAPPGDKMIAPQNAGFPMGVPLEVLFSGHGFALLGSESHILRLKVESIMPLEPDQIKGLLASNKSLEEIRDDILEKEGEKTNRGSMMLDRKIYPLVNIVVSTLGNNSTSLMADLADSGPQSNDTAILGGISLTIAPSDGGMIGKGELYIDQGTPSARYSLLIDMEPPRHGQDDHDGEGKMMREMSG
ncbi:MAG: hypothetical protein A4E49_00645 [Methanosaeta sp. PtaU1.Bin112]|nr:MAG: hypothetical protein A4E49_00645 [Methanosaeta sp. PtaU1.Bin112]